MRNISLVDQCCAELSTAVDELISRAQQYREDFLLKMQAWRGEFSREIEECITEVEATLAAEEVNLKGRYSSFLRYYRADSLALFSYNVDFSQADSWLQTMVSTCFLQPEVAGISWVTASTIQWFDACSFQLYPQVELSSRIQANIASSWATVDKQTVILCGGGTDPFEPSSDVWKSAYLLSKSGRVTSLPDMNFSHGYPGVIVWNGKVLVFGSYWEQGAKECERFRLTGTAWETLPQMHKQRCSFTAAVWQESVYLCGGQYNCTMERFDGASIHLLGFSLPEGTVSMACVNRDTLLIFTSCYLVILSISENQDNPLMRLKQRKGEIAQASSPPLLWNDVVYSFGIPSMSRTEHVLRYSAENGNSLD